MRSAADRVTETAGPSDTVRSHIAYTLGLGLERLELQGSGHINGTGNALNNTLIGNSGNNLLSGGGGVDHYTGGLGDDIFVLDRAGETVSEAPNGGKDSIRVLFAASALNIMDLAAAKYANVDNVTLLGLGAFTIQGNGDANELIGNADVTILNGSGGNDVLDGRGGNDQMSGGVGDDTFLVDVSGDAVNELVGDVGIDTVRSRATFSLSKPGAAGVENLNLLGNGNINATGNALSNTIVGNDGANILDGKGGVDTLIGKRGSDVYLVDDPGDIVTEAPAQGIDLVRARLADGQSYGLGNNVENLLLLGPSNSNGVGNTLANVITGNAGNNVLLGDAGNDTLTGNAGNDNLNGGLGIDTMNGGPGDDAYGVDNIKDIVAEDLAGPAGGVDTVSSTVNYVLGPNQENLILLEDNPLRGTGNALANTMTGNGGANTLKGGAGNDTLVAGGGDDAIDGGVGKDQMSGGPGNDTYTVDNVADQVTELDGEGDSDRVILVRSNALTTPVLMHMAVDFPEIEQLTVTGNGLFNISGTDGNDFIVGNAAANVIEGGQGDDNLAGGAGNDELIGGVGNDVLKAGAGADSLSGGDGNDTYVVDAADTIETDSSGTDTVIASVNVSFEDRLDLENLSASGLAPISLRGNSLNNIITGNDGANVLNGSGGADQMIGGKGNDTYFVDDAGDTVAETTGGAIGGLDLVNSSVSWILGERVENLTLSGGAPLSGTGNALNNVITGNGGDNQLSGGAGNDILRGGLGFDTLEGGDGADVFRFATGAAPTNIDTVLDFLSGTDRIQLENAIFSKLSQTSPNPLSAANFFAGDDANVNNIGTATTFVKFETDTGGLYYDADGSGAGAPIQIATIENGGLPATVIASDIFVT